MSELSKIDDTLLQMAANGKSGQEMASKTGLPAAKALLRVKEILRERDIWSEVERRQLLMDDLYRLKVKVQEQNADEDWMTDKQIIALSKVIRDIDEVMEKNGQINEELIGKASVATAAAMLRMIEAATNRAMEILSEEYPAIDKAVLQAAFQQGVQEASDVLD